jgi:diguanylate cyclase (GGDEF)-like protein
MRLSHIAMATGAVILAKKWSYWKQLALIDPITQSGNSLALRRFIRSRSQRPFSGSLFLFDIDQFSKVNSDFSYSTGDRVLSELVRRLGDRLGKSAKIFRYKYGDELLGIVEGGSEPDGETTKELFLRDLGDKSFSLPNNRGEIHVSVSIGHIFLRDAWLSNQSILVCLEERLRQSKKRAPDYGSKAGTPHRMGVARHS